MSIPPEERTICFCHHVSQARLKEAIQKGCHSIEAIQSQTGASTGCGGCEMEVQEILSATLEAISSPVGPTQE